MRTKHASAEVLYPDERFVALDRDDLASLKSSSSRNVRKRIRLCTHRHIEDALHEMFIVHERNTYIRPHKHLGKSESAHVIEGLADLILFDDAGKIAEVMPLGDWLSGRRFYYRIDIPMFHSLVIRSDMVVFHEVTTGPFVRADTVFPDWAPADDQADAVAAYYSALMARSAGPTASRHETGPVTR